MMHNDYGPGSVAAQTIGAYDRGSVHAQTIGAYDRGSVHAQTIGDDDPNVIAEAKAKLASMKRSLKSWLRIRKVNDEIETGKRPRKSAVSFPRNYEVEQSLANDLFAALSTVMDAQMLPDPDLSRNPRAAIELAEIVVHGKMTPSPGAPQATGILPLLVLTVGGVVFLSLAFAIKSKADVAKEIERQKCLREGDFFAKVACSEPSSLLVYAGLGYAGYWLWTKGGLSRRVQKAIGG